ncbi:hypothetical protein Dshi_0965 [Dinoroseobacter shibae DFL 12 = DSM 16493]|uniref:Uncharacterized protein n=1 Tax=Dinoroseobacter shibae (strain DSM 16493 / NCIMB 14021 / DFL 12) TaxID=398580 RepID=A8LS01_DINSH|nr:hypothetical protein Dshi_0965 [Dinoroseobacter shibae DFL 12 = DSM 16493]
MAVRAKTGHHHRTGSHPPDRVHPAPRLGAGLVPHRRTRGRPLAKTGNYKMDWMENYGGTIVKPKGMLEGVKLGLGDIGIVTTIFYSSKLPSQTTRCSPARRSRGCRISNGPRSPARA